MRTTDATRTSILTIAPPPTGVGSGPTTALATAPTTSAPTMDAPVTTVPVGIVRPFVDPGVCAPVSASESAPSVYALKPFARASTAPLPIQAIGNPATGATGPFAVVLRYANQDRPGYTKDLVEINGWAVGVRTFPNGNGEAVWNLDDGTQGYLRARGLGVSELTAIVTGLTARDATIAIPGFDYIAAQDADQLQLLAEHLSSDLSGHGASIECQVETTGFIYRISAIDADPISEFMTVIDRPPPVEVGRRDRTLIVIDGLADPTAPTIAQIDNLDPAKWAELLQRPPAN
jgi:hypothetical protein